MSQQDDGVAAPSHVEAPSTEFLPGRVALIGLGAVTSVLLGAMAFAQGVWNGGDSGNTRTTAAGADQAGEALLAPAEGGIPESPIDSPSVEVSSGTPKAGAASRNVADDVPMAAGRHPGTLLPSVHASTPASAKAVARTKSAARASSAGSQVKPSLTAWSSEASEDNDYWDMHVVTVRSNVPLTSLEVSVRVMQNGGVANTGTWTSLGDQVEVYSGADSEQVAYVITLKSGVTLQPGTYTFEFGFNHNKGTRDASGDLWNAAAASDKFSGTQMRSGRF